MRDLFEQAKQNAPCIIFMDEIDAVGRHRGAGMGGGHDEREQTLNQLLVEMDGFEMKDNIILIAATNRPDILDPALLRPGRFDRQIVVDRPDRDGRTQDPRGAHQGQAARPRDRPRRAGRPDARASPAPTSPTSSTRPRCSPRAAAASRSAMVELEEGIMRVIAGPEKKTRLITEKERVITADHEMGHALVGHYLETATRCTRSRSSAAAWRSATRLAADRGHVPDARKASCMRPLAMTLGGRTAEEIVFGEFTTGAANDLEKVTAHGQAHGHALGHEREARPAHVRPRPRPAVPGPRFRSEPDYSDEIAREIDDEIRRIVEEAHERARGC